MEYDLSRSLFSIKRKQFSCKDFIEALGFYGILTQWQNQVSAGNFYIGQASKSSKEPNTEVLQEWAMEFRYDHNLLSVEEFSLWLNSTGLNTEDFEKHLLRKYWTEMLEENVEQGEGDISDRELFAELYFSGSLENLLISWQKRLLAWADSQPGDFPSLEEAEENYRNYCRDEELFMDAESWLKLSQRDLTRLTLSCVPVEGEQSIQKALKGDTAGAFPVKEFFQDLPDAIAEIIDAGEEEPQGPVSVNGFDIVFKVEKCEPPSADDEEVKEIISAAYFEEVWKTLKVKYVRS